MRALVKYLDSISDRDIAETEIPTGVPLHYELDHDLNTLSRNYLGKPAVLDRREHEQPVARNNASKDEMTQNHLVGAAAG